MKDLSFILLLFVSSLLTLAQERTFQVLEDASVLNHWPGPDGLVGSADDVVNASLSPMNFSAANRGANNTGSLSYNAFNFGGPAEATLLPTPMNAVTFLRGTVTIDGAVGKSGGGPLIKAWTFSGTEPFPGHGAYTAAITRVNSGSYDVATKVLTQNINFTASLLAGSAPAANFTLTGQAYVIDAANFNTATGNAYVDNVLIPLAKNLGASGLFFARASGTVPASTGGSGGSFPAMPITAEVVGMERASVPVAPRITEIAIVPQGVRIRWEVESGRKYSVETTSSLGVAFSTLASNQSGPEYTDAAGAKLTEQYYRLRVE